MMRTPIILLLAIFLAGCAAVPGYPNTHTPNAATLVANNGFQGGGTMVEVYRIDGVSVPKPPLYLAPGWHHLSVLVNNTWNVDEDIIVQENRSYRVNILKNFHDFTFQLVDAASGRIYMQDPLLHLPPAPVE